MTAAGGDRQPWSVAEAPELRSRSASAELTGGAGRTVEDNLVVAVVVDVVVDVHKVSLPTKRACI
jgi:hypothetical protein